MSYIKLFHNIMDLPFRLYDFYRKRQNKKWIYWKM